MKTNKILLALIFVLLLGFVVDSNSSNFTVIWDNNTEEDLAGYRLYWGSESGVYSNKVLVMDNFKVFNHDSLDYPFNDSTKYFFAVTAFDTAYNESGYSNEDSLFIVISDTSAPATPTGCTIICN